MQADGVQRRSEDNRRLREALAERLAVNAQLMADTLDRAADLHEAIAADATHPLHHGSAERAAAERRFAAREREAASRWRTGGAHGNGHCADRGARADGDQPGDDAGRDAPPAR